MLERLRAWWRLRQWRAWWRGGERRSVARRLEGIKRRRYAPLEVPRIADLPPHGYPDDVNDAAAYGWGVPIPHARRPDEYMGGRGWRSPGQPTVASIDAAARRAHDLPLRTHPCPGCGFVHLDPGEAGRAAEGNRLQAREGADRSREMHSCYTPQNASYSGPDPRSQRVTGVPLGSVLPPPRGPQVRYGLGGDRLPDEARHPEYLP